MTCAAFGLTLAAGCGQSCYEQGCQSEIEVQLAQPLTQTGLYEVEVVIDGQREECEFRLMPSSRDTTDTCRLLFLVEAGRMQMNQIEGLVLAPINEFDRTVSNAEIHISYQGEKVVEHVFAPQYTSLGEINGPGCGVCNEAQPETMATNLPGN